MKLLTEKISLWQLFILIFIFEVGSAAIVSTGDDAEQNAWIAVLVATGLGMVLTYCYFILLSRLPGKNFFEIIRYCLGKWLGNLVSFLYILYFVYIASRVLRDFCELIISFIFTRTPVEVVSLTMMMVICYMIYLGLEVIGRTSEIFVPYFFSFIIFIGIAILISGEMDFKNLAPFMGDGVKPILKAVFPQLLTFPFGEMVAFLMIIPYTTKIKQARKVAIGAVGLSGLILVYNSLLQVATLGASMKARSNFPLLSAAREISLLDFLERVDLLVVFIVMYGIIVKVGVFTYGALRGLELLSNRPYRMMVVPIGTIIAFLSIKVSDNFAEHIEEGLIIVPYFMHIPFQFVIPLCLMPIIIWKTKKKETSS